MKTEQDAWVSQRKSEILADPAKTASAFATYCRLNLTKCGQVLSAAAGSGTVGSMVELGELLDMAAEIAADDDWHAMRKVAYEAAVHSKVIDAFLRSAA